MVAYSFQKRFVGHVEAGLEPGPWCPGMKRHTLRLPRAGQSRHARSGEKVQLYTAMRTKHCRPIGVGHVVAVRPVQLQMEHDGEARRLDITPRAGSQELYWTDWDAQVAPAARHLLVSAPGDGHPDMDAFARTDGFRDAADMAAFFEAPAEDGIHVCDLVLICWAPLR